MLTIAKINEISFPLPGEVVCPVFAAKGYDGKEHAGPKSVG